MSEYILYRCDYCGCEQQALVGSIGPSGWLQVQQQGEEQNRHFCSHACLVMYGHDHADYRMLSKADRLRTALQSLGLLPRPGAAPPQLEP